METIKGKIVNFFERKRKDIIICVLIIIIGCMTYVYFKVNSPLLFILLVGMTMGGLLYIDLKY